jgi:hypothetical protein
MASLRGTSTRHTILELDANSCESDELSQRQWKADLFRGTSVLIDPREPPKRGGQVEETPGQWMSTQLKSLSNPFEKKAGGPSSLSRSEMHTQYSIQASFRLPSSSMAFEATPFQQQRFRHPLLQCIMEGVAEQTRPIGSFSTCLLRQSFGELTSGGYGYWKQTSLMSKQQQQSTGEQQQHHQEGDRSIVATLGNSTRMHPVLTQKYKSMKGALARFGGGGTRGFYSTDVSAGLAPELEDCGEALEYLKDLDAIYCPPGGDEDEIMNDGDFDE